MWQTLFTIPKQIAGVDLFGFGWLLGIWAVVTACMLGVSLFRSGWNKETRDLALVLSMIGLSIGVIFPFFQRPEGLAIRGYGVMFVLALVASAWLGVYRARRMGVDPEVILSLAWWFGVSGIIGARLFYVVQYWGEFHRPTLRETTSAILNFTEGGLVVYGSLLAGGAALLVFIYRYKLPGLALADLIAPAVVLGVGLGRLGCFMNGCCYGGISDVPWAVRFPDTSPAYIDQARQGSVYLHGLLFRGRENDPPIINDVEAGSQAEQHGLKAGERIAEINGRAVRSVDEAQFELMKTHGAGTSVSIRVSDDTQTKQWTVAGPPPRSRPVHPTQLYSLIDALLLMFFLLACEPFKRCDGELTALVLTIHPISRFLLEYIRVDEGSVLNTGLTIAQNISIAIFAGGVLLWIYLAMRRPAGRPWPEEATLTGTVRPLKAAG